MSELERPEAEREEFESIDWEQALAEAPESRVVKIGDQKIVMVAPVDAVAIEGQHPGDKKLEVFAKNVTTSTGIDTKPGDIYIFRLIRLCMQVRNKPTNETLAKMRRSQGPAFMLLKQTAMSLCGLLDVEAEMEKALGNSDGDLQ